MYRDDKIRAAMGAKDWNIQILAEKSGVSTQTISLMRRGNPNVKIENLKKVADALEIPMADLFEGTVPPSGPAVQTAPGLV